MTAAGQTVGDLKITLDTASLTAFAPDPNLGNLLSGDVSAAFAGGLLGVHIITIVNGGDLAPANPQPSQPAAADDSKLLDIMVYVQYTLS